MRTRLILDTGLSRWWLKGAIVLAALSHCQGDSLAWGQVSTASQISRPLKSRDAALKYAALDAAAEKGEKHAPQIELSTAEIRTDTPAVAGAKLVLQIGSGAPSGTRFRWAQIEGPLVDIADPSKSSIEITIPAAADRLGFLLITAHADWVRVVRVNVPLASDPTRTSWGSNPSGNVKADAGDDQIGLVGHRVTLNGSRSRPGNGSNSRWLQIAGPPIQAPDRQGFFLSFVPTAPGLHRFLLLISNNGEVSEPDEVSVLVGSPPGLAAGGQQPPTLAVQPPASPSPTPTSEQTISAVVPRIPNGTRVASDVADVMEAIAQRTKLYESFGMLQSELVRRLDVVIPTEPSQRSAWMDGVFSPLSNEVVGRLLSGGLDLRQPQGQAQPLTTAQQDQLCYQFEKFARSFRAITASR